MKIRNDSQEVYGWIGNSIFLTAQIAQVIHTHNVKDTRDISYFLIVLLFIGDIMYTFFGYIDDSFSLFLGSALSCVTLLILLIQKIYYENYYKRETLLGNNYNFINSEYNSI